MVTQGFGHRQQTLCRLNCTPNPFLPFFLLRSLPPSLPFFLSFLPPLVPPSLLPSFLSFLLCSYITSQLQLPLPPLLPVPPHQLPSPPDPLLLSLEKMAELLGIATNYGISNYNENRHFSSYKAGEGPVARKGPKSRQKSQRQPLLTVLVPQEHQAIQS